ncbi:hypothetical protein COO91_06573 [Nostoc flagelliforme CCNUN1]|uniref:Uncharacterized protein n=1 Tax=Nostoc flagelliforme CCNUN1 TaxID=2038116 RepID=A0A2K8SYN3_9NOSO|nr:hypothetical protein COO91_06573 [Nostoc flagelliforme CCNUN1]
MPEFPLAFADLVTVRAIDSLIVAYLLLKHMLTVLMPLESM